MSRGGNGKFSKNKISEKIYIFTWNGFILLSMFRKKKLRKKITQKLSFFLSKVHFFRLLVNFVSDILLFDLTYIDLPSNIVNSAFI